MINKTPRLRIVTTPQTPMIKIGLLGIGHLGKIHLRLIKEIDAFNFVGFYDTNTETAQKVSEEFQIPAWNSAEDLIDAVDAVDIVTPTLSHFTYAKQALNKGKHIFIEKPLTHTVEEARELKELVEATGLKAQVGHVERFNPAFLAVEDRHLEPMFIEGHRLAKYNPRGTDVSVVLDLMIHDLDVILSMVKSPIHHISASGVAVISDTPDIANARLEFENGCVANLTASRISVKNMRRLRMFQKNTYLAIDFLEKKSEIFNITEEEGEDGVMRFPLDSGTHTKYLVYDLPEVKPVNSIKMELEEFASAIIDNTPVKVSINDGFLALRTAHEILHKIKELESKVKLEK